MEASVWTYAALAAALFSIACAGIAIIRTWRLARLIDDVGLAYRMMMQSELDFRRRGQRLDQLLDQADQSASKRSGERFSAPGDSSDISRGH